MNHTLHPSAKKYVSFLQWRSTSDFLQDFFTNNQEGIVCTPLYILLGGEGWNFYQISRRRGAWHNEKEVGELFEVGFAIFT